MIYTITNIIMYFILFILYCNSIMFTIRYVTSSPFFIMLLMLLYLLDMTYINIDMVMYIIYILYDLCLVL
ncbi:hypothetical protein EHP00_2006 [Ecytonucleospora hepatopenaei]|uniref:Uncharacterized protein n=1 Tax=Ecytonucleospora hepatopenaei TaxID=646526 RepID=A0A1W0E8R8_9MICR|nr:hypothetical protein EHP00_2006 [Ecytonucleospora hepatopenaei]